MRIVAGEFRSRKIQAVSGDSTRPTTDKIKEAVFSRIGPYFDGGIMLDLFAGSGNMGLEALSRGMEECYFCDQSYAAIQTIKANITALQVMERCHVVKGDYRMMLQKMAREKQQFALIYLDPPYRKQRLDEILHFIGEHQLLQEQGHVVAESLKEDIFADTYADLYKEKDVTYGITRISYYTR